MPHKPKGDFQASKLKRSALAEVRLGYHFPYFDTDLSISHLNRYKLISHSVGAETNTRDFNFEHRSKVRSTAIMLNGYYNFTPFASLTPYVGIGAGLAHNKLADTTVHYSVGNVHDANFKIKKGAKRNDFAWQIMAGARMSLTDKLELTAEYKYMDLGKMKTADNYVVTNAGFAPVGTVYKDHVAKGKLRSDNVLIGLRYSF